MKIVVITGSPRKNGTSFLLTQEFIAGAQSKGHEIVRFDVGQGGIHPCQGCDHCRTHDGQCIFHDEMDQIAPAVCSADLIVLAMPLYYYGMPAQIKAVIDRFYAVNSVLMEKPMGAVLLATCGDNEDWTLQALVHHYETICRYLHWENIGMVLAPGVYQRADLEGTEYPMQAHALGASL